MPLLSSCPSCDHFIQRAATACPFCGVSRVDSTSLRDRLHQLLCVSIASASMVGAIMIPGCAYGLAPDACMDMCTIDEICTLTDESLCDDQGNCEDGAYTCVSDSDSASNGTSNGTSGGTSGGGSSSGGQDASASGDATNDDASGDATNNDASGDGGGDVIEDATADVP